MTDAFKASELTAFSSSCLWSACPSEPNILLDQQLGSSQQNLRPYFLRARDRERKIHFLLRARLNRPNRPTVHQPSRQQVPSLTKALVLRPLKPRIDPNASLPAQYSCGNDVPETLQD